MNLSSEIKTRLTPYLEEQQGLAPFREWFAAVLGTVARYGEVDQILIWSLDREFAYFGTGRITKAELRANLKRLVDALSRPQEVATAAPGVAVVDAGQNIRLSSSALVVNADNLNRSCFANLNVSVFHTQFFPWSASGNCIQWSASGDKTVHLEIPQPTVCPAGPLVEVTSQSRPAA